MLVEAVEAPSLLELRATVATRLRAYGAFEGCTIEEQRAILAQACVVIWHLTAGDDGRQLYRTHLGPPADEALAERVLDTIMGLCPDVVDAVRRYIPTWRARFRQDGWHPAQWGGCCDGVNGALLEVFVTDSRQLALAACERDAS